MCREMSPKSGRTVYKLAGGALRSLGEVGEGDLQGDSTMDKVPYCR